MTTRPRSANCTWSSSSAWVPTRMPGVAGEHVAQRAAARPHAGRAGEQRHPGRTAPRRAELARPGAERAEQRGDRPVVLLRENLGRARAAPPARRRPPPAAWPAPRRRSCPSRPRPAAAGSSGRRRPGRGRSPRRPTAALGERERQPPVERGGEPVRDRRARHRGHRRGGEPPLGERGLHGERLVPLEPLARARCRSSRSVGRWIARSASSRGHRSYRSRDLGGSGSSPASSASRTAPTAWRSSTRSAWRSPGRPGSARWRTPRRARWPAGRRRRDRAAARTRGGRAGGGRGSWTPCPRTGRARPAVSCLAWNPTPAKKVSCSLPVPSVTMTSSRLLGRRGRRLRLAGTGPPSTAGRCHPGEHGDVVALAQRVERGQLAPGVVAARVVAQQVADRAQAEDLLERVARPSCPAAGPADRGAWSRGQHRSDADIRRYAAHPRRRDAGHPRGRWPTAAVRARFARAAGLRVCSAGCLWFRAGVVLAAPAEALTDFSQSY